MNEPSADIATFLFTDIEGSTRMWEEDAVRMHAALAAHDALVQRCVTGHHGRVVKSTGDGVHAVFDDPLGGVAAALDLQIGLLDPAVTAGVPLRVRCGLHAGANTRRGGDFYGTVVNRAARLMSVAHGGQVLLSAAVTELVRERLPKGAGVRALGAVRLRDLAEAEQVHQLVHDRLRDQFPPLRSLEHTPNNLPQAISDFIGREHELAEVPRLLTTARLVTIVGTGGLGKSRLALHVASDLLDRYPDGVWLVELAPVADPRLVPQAVASVLGVELDSARSITKAITRFTRDRRLLLVLDNCEHLTQACASLARTLLESAPQMHILATSRERLGIAGERTFPLAPFLVPAPHERLSTEALGQFASVRLFTDRAASAHPGFALDVDNATAVAEVCQRLDGIPLAIELAAARVRAMPVQKIAERLTDRFRLLSGGDRTALPRQQTLRALIDWSYDLLTDAERALFRSLSVFAGGFTLEAAERVGESIEDADVIVILAQLVEKSLVTNDGNGARYGMLETIRQYAQDRLDERQEGARARDAHFAHFIAFAEEARPELVGPRQREWLARLDVERENFAAAHAWCDHATNGGEFGLRLVRALRTYSLNRGLVTVGLAATVEALARPGAQERNLLRCRVLADAGNLAARGGAHAEALRFLEESLAIARELGDESRIAITLQPIGRTHAALGDLRRAQANLDEALALARKSGDRREIAAALSSLGVIEQQQRNFDRAEALCVEALQELRSVGDLQAITVLCLSLGAIHVLQGALTSARERLVEAVGFTEASGASADILGVLDVAAGLAAAERDWPSAARFYGAAESLASASGLGREPADLHFLNEQMETVRAALSPEDFALASSAGGAITQTEALPEIRRWLATGHATGP